MDQAASLHTDPASGVSIIARRRYFRPQENVRRLPRINDQIRKSPIRLIDHNENMIGIIEVAEAVAMAREAGLDLVEVSPDSDPPVCRILDFGKYRFEQSKKERANRAKSKAAEMKEVRLGRSMKIDPHDIKIRLDQARRFLMDGHKVQIVQNFRGREMLHKERGKDRMQHVVDTLGDIARVEMTPRFAGRRMTMILAPDKAKIGRIKAQEAKANAPVPDAPKVPEAPEPPEAPEAPAEHDAAAATPASDDA